ncbi:MAG: translation elongation factor Ts [Methylococcales bacterium]|nr:translation elongation factor Ts [Methylococcales bacterium]
MSITAAMVKELRERTGSGMMECKKALVESNGDLELAIENMRKAGLAKADKKSGRTAAEGLIGIRISADQHQAVIVDVNCETDFVAKGDDFSQFVDQITEALLNNANVTAENSDALPLANGKTLDETRRELIAKLGENITLRRFTRFQNNEHFFVSYQHGSKIGVLVELANEDETLGKDIAMHIAAVKPQCVSEDQVSEDIVEKEKEIFTAQALESGKPAEIVEKMIGGRIKKFLAEITLLGQPFVKDDKTSVGQLLTSKNNAVIAFTRYEVGEGIEKKEENFAEEVMAQINAV